MESGRVSLRMVGLSEMSHDCFNLHVDNLMTVHFFTIFRPNRKWEDIHDDGIGYDRHESRQSS